MHFKFKTLSFFLLLSLSSAFPVSAGYYDSIFISPTHVRIPVEGATFVLYFRWLPVRYQEACELDILRCYPYAPTRDNCAFEQNDAMHAELCRKIRANWLSISRAQAIPPGSKGGKPHSEADRLMDN